MVARDPVKADMLQTLAECMFGGDLDAGLVLADALEELDYGDVSKRIRFSVQSSQFQKTKRSGPGWVRLRRKVFDVLRLVRHDVNLRALQKLALKVVQLRGRRRHEAAMALGAELDRVEWPKSEGVPTGRSGKPSVWEVATLDVWGNRQDGYEINNWFRAGTIRLPTRELVFNVQSYRDSYLKGYRVMASRRVFARGVEDDEALETAVRRQFLQPGARVDFEDSGGGEVTVEARGTGMPLLQLRSVEEDS